jgi:uncharacterized cupin superfamily protein
VVSEADLQETPSGLAPVTPGWFVVNVRDTAWESNPKFGSACIFESRKAEFDQLGINLRVLQPGQCNGYYHTESHQEDFLVLAGECLLLVEGQERQLKAWDFVHCPPGAAHIFVGAGSGPCVILMTGRRDPGNKLFYPRSEIALRHGAGVETETTSPAEAYAGEPDDEMTRPGGWADLPWVAG